MDPFGELSERWRDEAANLRDWGAEEAATALERCAKQLQAKGREFFLETLTLSQAAEEMGVSYDTMSRKIRNGEIPNAGEKHKPAVLRRDIVRGIDAPGPHPLTEDGDPDLAALVSR